MSDLAPGLSHRENIHPLLPYESLHLRLLNFKDLSSLPQGRGSNTLAPQPFFGHSCRFSNQLSQTQLSQIKLSQSCHKPSCHKAVTHQVVTKLSQAVTQAYMYVCSLQARVTQTVHTLTLASWRLSLKMTVACSLTSKESSRTAAALASARASARASAAATASRMAEAWASARADASATARARALAFASARASAWPVAVTLACKMTS